MSAPTRVTLRIPNLPEFVAVARMTVAAVASRMDFSYDVVDDIKVAVGEACTNAIEHAGHEHLPQNEIEICCLMCDSELIVEVRDQGKGFDPTLNSEPDVLSEGGLGLMLINALMDEVHLTSLAGQGTQVRMVKRLTSAPSAPRI